tara:strand:+ start:323 stop:493 length:171 start_codon:yes stop_codon:yes gene_type:complete
MELEETPYREIVEANTLTSIAESLSAISTSLNFIMVLLACLVIFKGINQIYKFIEY